MIREAAAAFAAAPIEDQIGYVVIFLVCFTCLGGWTALGNVLSCFVPAAAMPDRRNERG